MSKFYLANCTSQIQTFNYRLPERTTGGHAVQHIDVGRQSRIAGDLSTPQIESLIEQVERYGARPAIDTQKWRQGQIVPMIYSVDKPVSHDTMLQVIEFNSGLLFARGTQLRKEAAIATSHGMRNMTPQAADRVQLSVEEEKPGTMLHEGGQAGLAEGFRMKVGDEPDVQH